MKIDIDIDGVGFYSIRGGSERGRSWVSRNVQGSESGAACSDDTRMTEDIADGATSEGLNVAVNGYLYLLGGKRGVEVSR